MTDRIFNSFIFNYIPILLPTPLLPLFTGGELEAVGLKFCLFPPLGFFRLVSNSLLTGVEVDNPPAL